MLKNQKTKLLITSMIILIPILVGLFLWNKLPDQMVTHWDASGVPNGWSSKLFTVVGLPAFLLLIHWVCIIATKMDPKAASHPLKMLSLVYWMCPAVSVFCMASVYGEALGYPVSVDRIGTIFVGLIFIIVGNYLPKCPHNYTIGIKIPWTLNSEENWNRTHRFAGPIWVIAGFLFIITSFIGSVVFGIIIILAASFFPMIYSYLYYKKYESK